MILSHLEELILVNVLRTMLVQTAVSSKFRLIHNYIFVYIINKNVDVQTQHLSFDVTLNVHSKCVINIDLLGSNFVFDLNICTY
jgi:hypothetical protein